MTDASTQLPHCGLLRRLAAIVYDSLLLLAVLFAATAILVPFTSSDTGGSVPAPIYGSHPIHKAMFTTYVFLVSYLFFAWFWTHGGQTLGMRAWRIRAQTREGTAMSWTQAMLRFLVAIPSWGVFGLGFLWSLVDREKMTWHDRYSETVVVVVDKKTGKG